MISIRPYLLRAYFDWIVDNGWTPYLLADAAYPGVEVPQEFASEGRIVLNVAPRAVRDFVITNDTLTFSARFAGTPHRVFVPVEAVLAIYPQETGEGITFPVSRPAPAAEGAAPEAPKPAAPALAPEPPTPAPSGPRRPALRIVKDK
jgi:stringent starvation protein B